MKNEVVNIGVAEGVDPVDSGVGSGSLDPHDSVSERGEDHGVEGADNDPVLALALDGYSKFMLRALEVVVGADARAAADVKYMVESYASVVGGCVSAAVVSSSALPVSVNGSSAGVSVRSGSLYSGAGTVRSGAMRSLSFPRTTVNLPRVRSAGPSLLRSDVCGPGTCYLRFVAAGCRTAARKCLGVWPTVRALLRSPAALFDADLMDSCRFVQVSPDMYHVESSGGDSYQVAVGASLLRTVSCLGQGDFEQFAEGSLGKLLCSKRSGGCAVPLLPLDAKVGGSVRCASPPLGASWSEQARWCDLQGYCSDYWKQGVCHDASCGASHARVSAARLRDTSYPCVSWSRSQKAKWCKHNGVCWKVAYFGECHEGASCQYSHALPLGLLARFSLVRDSDVDVDVDSSGSGVAASSACSLPPVRVPSRVSGAVSGRLVLLPHLATGLMSMRVVMDGTNSRHSVPRHVVVENSCGQVVCAFGVDAGCGLDAVSQLPGCVGYWEARGIVKRLFETSAIDVSSSFGYESFFSVARLHRDS